MLSTLIIGCGNIAGGFDATLPSGSLPRSHAGAYTAHGHFTVDACVEPDEAKRHAFMQRWRVAHGFATLQQLINESSQPGRFDVISICSSTEAHYNDVQLALTLAPRLIFCEKPVCSKLSDFKQLIEHCEKQGVQLAVNHNRRWDPDVTRLRDELDAGVWGAVRSASGYYNKGVLNNGSHMVDLLLNLLGPLTLRAVGKPCFDFWASDPSVPATLLTNAGVIAGLDCGHASDYSLFELQLVTEKGVITMEEGGQRWRVRMSESSQQFAGYQTLPIGLFREGRYLESMRGAVDNIYQTLTGNATLTSTGNTAFAAHLICQQILDNTLTSA
jgi:predicted dehydrogenase